VRPKMVETTALGAALVAGFAVGIWSMHSVKSNCDTFIQTLSDEGKYSIHYAIVIKFLQIFKYTQIK